MWSQRSEPHGTPREACVYVNNMNTATATTALPDRRVMQRRGNRGCNRDGSYPVDDMLPTSGLYGGGGPDEGDAMGVPPLGVGAVGGAGDTVGHETIMTQRLERAYQRIMRRLQRQLNYEEPSRVPLVQQLQLGTEGQADGDEKKSDTGVGAARVDGATSPRRESTTVGSTIVRYRADSLCGGNGGAEDADADGEEHALALQPCPMALRLVLHHVQAVLQNKMRLAESGSMKDCLRYTFESRALLDRLLKELPTYVQFQEPMLAGSRAAQLVGKDRVVAGGGNGIHLHELYKSFRKQPVLLPRGRYVEDRDTGAVGAELDLSQERAMAGGEAARLDGSGVSLPRLVLPRVGLGVDVASRGAGGGQEEHSGHASPARSDSATPATVSLPASYGRSARLAPSLEERSDEDETGLVMRHATRWRGAEETTGRAAVVMNGSNAHRASLGEGAMGEFTLTDSTGMMMLASTTRQRRLQPKLRTLLATYSEKERQATQTTEVGTLTEANATTMVSRSAYEALEERVKELEVLLQEARNEQQSLVAQLQDEETHTAGRARIIQYLRHTLVRECNTLRSQLYFAAQKEQQLVQQQQQRHQQQQQQQSLPGRERYNVPTSASMQGTSNSHSASVAAGAAHMPPHLTHHNNVARSGRSSPRLPLAPNTPQRRVTTTGTIDSGASDANRNEISVVSQGSPYGVPHEGGGVSLTNRPHRESSSHECGNSLVEHPTVGRDASGSGGLVANDITAVQSLLDLVLLAVEKEAPLPVSVQAARDMDADDVEQLIDADAQTHWRVARAEFEQKQRTLKEMVTSMRVRNTFLLATKEKEIARLQSLTDMQFVHRAIADAVGELRSHHKQLRRYAQDQLYTFQVNLTTTIASFSNRIKLVERTLVEHAALQNTHDALRDLVESAGSLLLPMLTTEYTHGYHPWPIKVRNTTDPLAQAIQLQHGQVEVVHLRPQLDMFNRIYVTLHDYVMRSVVVPEMNRPAPGLTLRRLCCALMLSPVSNTELLYAVRQHYATECELCRELANLNGRILWNAYLQRAYTERAVSALIEGGMSPNTTSLPAAPRINALAREREVLTRARTTAQKRRLGNAKEVYRLWREKQIDIYNGYPAPVFHNRLTLLTEGHNAVRARRGTQQSRLLSTSGVDGTSAAGHVAAHTRPRLSESGMDRRLVTISPVAVSLETGRSLSTIDVQ